MRKAERTIILGKEFPTIIGLCGTGFQLRATFAEETAANKIVITLTEKIFAEQLALCDEVFILNDENGFTDLQSEVSIEAKRLGKTVFNLVD